MPIYNPIGISADEFTYYLNKAALLDPAAYELKDKPTLGASWTETVPSDETWFLVNGWYLLINSGADAYFQRVADVDVAVPLAPGTTLAFSTLAAGAFAYLCKPSLVSSGAAYANPKQLYYSRLARLWLLPQTLISATVAAGSAFGTQASTAFPADFDNGMLLGYSIQDTAWAGLEVPGTLTMNMNWEVSDDHEVRLAQRLMCPFVRATFPNWKTRGANPVGVITQIDGRCIANAYAPVLNATGTWARMTLDVGITITRVIVTVGHASSGASTNAVVRVGNATHNVLVTIADGVGQNDSGAVSVSLAAGENLDFRVNTAYVGADPPTQANIEVQYALTAANGNTLLGWAQAIYAKLPADW